MVAKEDKPRYLHGCNECLWLGQFNEYDLYFCYQNGIPTAIARYGDSEDYKSGLIFAELGFDEALAEANRRRLKLIADSQREVEAIYPYNNCNGTHFQTPNDIMVS
ncbi:MAG: hypothetical protein NTV06_10160 [candidate division Zixibacteria bacterium]|nr:hypothetical protein [candidate division Zixibacteria bacterium]